MRTFIADTPAISRILPLRTRRGRPAPLLRQSQRLSCPLGCHGTSRGHDELPSSTTVLERSILDVLEALRAALEVFRSKIVASLGVLVDVQLCQISAPLHPINHIKPTVSVFADILPLHNVLPQYPRHALRMLNALHSFYTSGREPAVLIERVTGELSGDAFGCLVTCRASVTKARSNVEFHALPLKARPVARRRCRYVASTTCRL